MWKREQKNTNEVKCVCYIVVVVTHLLPKLSFCHTIYNLYSTHKLYILWLVEEVTPSRFSLLVLHIIGPVEIPKKYKSIAHVWTVKENNPKLSYTCHPCTVTNCSNVVKYRYKGTYCTVLISDSLFYERRTIWIKLSLMKWVFAKKTIKGLTTFHLWSTIEVIYASADGFYLPFEPVQWQGYVF